MDDDFFKMLRQMFIVEASEHLKAMSSGLLALEKPHAPDARRTLVENVFRAAHSLKGAARATDLLEIETICQDLEDVFALWKRGETTPTPAAIDTALGQLDSIEAVISGLDSGAKAASGESTSPPRKSPEPDSAPSESPTRDWMESPQGYSPRSSFVETVEPSGPVQESKATEAYRTEPHPPVALSPSPPPDAGTAVVEQTVRVSVEKLDARLVEAEEMLTVKLTMAQRVRDLREVGLRFEAWQQAWASVESEVHELRRNSDRRTSERSEQAGPGLDRILEFLNWNRDYVRHLDEKVASLTRVAESDRRSLGRLVDDLLHDSKKLLLLPFATLVSPFPKLVRDLCRDQGKEADLVLRGEQVEIDKRILEEMKDPLIHLIRNCVDHGVEAPDRRAQAGKPARATITIAASPLDGSNVQILVSDDGGGINTQKVKASAVRLGIISEQEARTMPDHEAQMLIFHDEVSTSSVVSRLSGRGLGMAIVRERVEKLGGGVNVESRPGIGSVFRFVLPSMLATFRGVLVEAGGQGFVVPTSLVERVARYRDDDVKTVEGRQTVRLSGRVLSLVGLSDALGLRESSGRGPGGESRTPQGAESARTMLVLGSGDHRIAFGIDAVLEEQEVLVKPLRKPLTRVRNIAGVTVLGSGRVVPILNVPDLLKSARKIGATVSATAARTPKPEDSPTQVKSILVAEDSVTSRMLIKGILESVGYKVKTAVDGMDAFIMLRSEPFDLLVSDVDMPRLDGFGLTTRVRAEKGLRDLPVVLVTARETPEDKERGFDAGANAYIVKSRLDNSNLIEAVQRLI